MDVEVGLLLLLGLAFAGFAFTLRRALLWQITSWRIWSRWLSGSTRDSKKAEALRADTGPHLLWLNPNSIGLVQGYMLLATVTGKMRPQAWHHIYWDGDEAWVSLYTTDPRTATFVGSVYVTQKGEYAPFTNKNGGLFNG